MSNPADNTELCPVCGLAPQVRGCTPGKCRAPQTAPELPPEKWVLTSRGARPATTAEAAAAPTHPLPWRWTDHNGDALLDGDGRVMLVLANAGPVAPYVRAVTERAGAMDRALRWAMSWLDDFVDFDDHESEQRMKATAARKLLAEIDAAKGGG